MVKFATAPHDRRRPWLRHCLLALAAFSVACSVPHVSLAEDGKGADSTVAAAPTDTASKAGNTASGVVLSEYLIAGDDSRVRIILHFDTRPAFSWFLLRSPHRLVIDLPKTDFGIDEETVTSRGLIADLRYGTMAENQSRMIFSAKGPFKIEDASLLDNEQGLGARLVVDLVAASEEDFDRIILERMNAAQKATEGARASSHTSDSPRDHRFTIAIDPGHGGIDGGARGISGTQEKDITLAFAQELKRNLEATGKFRAVLTRESDVFLRLDERVRIAREKGANLLISVHADAIRLKNFRGSTIYTLSERASDAEAAATAARENLSDELAGLAASDEIRNDVADILADLMRRETHAFSIQFARTLVNEISNTIQFVNNPMRSAGFRVLRAHDVPSVLLELGYLSNADDEKLLNDPKWRERAAREISRAVDIFATAHARASN